MKAFRRSRRPVFRSAATPRVTAEYSSSIASSGFSPVGFSPITLGVQRITRAPPARIRSTRLRSPLSNASFGVPWPRWECQTSLIPM